MNEIQMEQIVEQLGKDILRFCRIVAGSQEEGDDLYQDTMLTLLEKQDRLEAVENIKSYVLSIALRLWKNRRRKNIRRFHLVPQESLEDLEEKGVLTGGEGMPSPEELLIVRDRMLLVRHLVAQLPEKYRLPIQLYYSADLTVSAAAQVLRLPENTVKSRLHRGKEKIRRQLEEMEYE